MMQTEARPRSFVMTAGACSGELFPSQSSLGARIRIENCRPS